MVDVESAWHLEADHLRAVIEAVYSLIKIGQIESAGVLLKSFSSELAGLGHLLIKKIIP